MMFSTAGPCRGWGRDAPACAFNDPTGRLVIVGMFKCTRLVYSGYSGLKQEARLQTLKSRSRGEE